MKHINVLYLLLLFSKGEYFIAIILITSLAVGLSVFILHIHNRLPNDKPVPVWLKKMVTILSPILGSTGYSNGKPLSASVLCYDNSAASISGKLAEKNGLSNKAKKLKLFISPEEPSQVVRLEQSVISINDYLKLLVGRCHDQDGDEEIMAEWKYVARALDRLFFILYIVVTVATTFAIFAKPKTNTSYE